MKEKLREKIRQVIDEVNQLPPEERRATVIEMEEEFKRLFFINGDSVYGFVFTTINPGRFKTISGNRIVDADSAYVRNLAESLSKFGNVSPIVLNSNEEVIDGQRRILAVMKYDLDTHLRYIIDQNASIETVGDINRLQVKWTFSDWLHKYVELRNANYVAYADIADRYSAYMKSRSLRSILMYDRVGPFQARIWEGGAFVIKEDSLGRTTEFLEFLKKVADIGDKENIFARDRNFQKAMHDIYKASKNFHEETWLERIKLGFGRLNVRTGYREYSKILKRVYKIPINEKVTMEEGA